jgi:exopolyphosphatase/guanosine-5'-triphosphate,3'-diphosphate pyrophosphatase
MQKIAAIDTGSNAIRLVVADLDDQWQVQPIENLRTPVRLGQDAFTNGILQEVTLQAAVDAFVQFRRIADDFGVSRIKAVATAAVREAQNSAILIDRIARASGIELEVISGEEEARLIYQAVVAAVNLEGKNALLVDIGGGSVEITLTRGTNILSTNSYAMGTVRLLQRLDWNAYSKNPMAFGLLVREYVETVSRRIRREIGDEKIDLCIGTGGNVEEIGKLRQRLFKRENDRLVRVDELEKLVDRLSHMSYQDRIRKLGLRPDRADVILPATTVLKLVASLAGVDEVMIPNIGLKNGLLLDMAVSMAQEIRLPKPDQVQASTIRLGKKYQFDQEHATFVAMMSLRLFDQCVKVHRLDGEERLVLESAAMLHDVGHFISTIDHDKHGQYILQANHLIGLSERQQEMVAAVVRFHRKGTPFLDGQVETTLSQKDRRVVLMLTAILRLADGMDAGHNQHITDVQLIERSNGWSLKLLGKGDLALDKWSVSKRSSLFQDVFGIPLEING